MSLQEIVSAATPSALPLRDFSSFSTMSGLYRNSDIPLDVEMERSVESVDLVPVKSLQEYDVPARFHRPCQLHAVSRANFL